jgi:hypothetical protein
VSEPIHAAGQVGSAPEQRWMLWLILFLRSMAGVSLVKGVYHWSLILGVGDGIGSTFEMGAAPWQAATIYFAVIDPVAAVGLCLAAAWGGVLWLTAAISMVAIEIFFPQVFGGRAWIIGAEAVAMLVYFVLTFLAARERPE